jgi:hypothetical protein
MTTEDGPIHIVYTCGDPLAQRQNANVTVVPTGEATAGGAISGAVASMLCKTERSAQGLIEVATVPVKK